MLFLLFNRRKLINNIKCIFRNIEHVTYIEQEIAHKSSTNNLLGTNLSRYGQHLFWIKRYQITIFIFCNDGEEIQQFMYILLSLLYRPASTGSVWIQIIGKLFKYSKGSCRVKVKYISILFTSKLWISSSVRATCSDQARILCPKCCLHIQRRTGYVRQYEYCRPFRNSNASGKLSDGKCDRFIVFLNGTDNLIVCFTRYIFIAFTSVTNRCYNMIILKYGMIVKFPFESIYAVNPVKKP